MLTLFLFKVTHLCVSKLGSFLKHWIGADILLDNLIGSDVIARDEAIGLLRYLPPGADVIRWHHNETQVAHGTRSWMIQSIIFYYYVTYYTYIYCFSRHGSNYEH